MSKIRILDKSKKCNKRCSSCKYWNSDNRYCSNSCSDNYKEHTNYWNFCNRFEWSSDICDKNDITNCKYVQLGITDKHLKDAKNTPICMYYSSVMQKNGKLWACYPACLEDNCPLKHPKLLRSFDFRGYLKDR